LKKIVTHHSSDFKKAKLKNRRTELRQKKLHQGIDGKVPNRSMAPEISMTDIQNMKLEKTPRLEGLITQFSLAA